MDFIPFGLLPFAFSPYQLFRLGRQCTGCLYFILMNPIVITVLVYCNKVDLSTIPGTKSYEISMNSSMGWYLILDLNDIGVDRSKFN